MQDNPNNSQAATNITYEVFSQLPTLNFDDIQYDSPAVYCTASPSKSSMHKANEGDCDMVKNMSYAAPNVS